MFIGIGWKMAAIVWAFSLGIFLLEDLAKVYYYYAIAHQEPDTSMKKLKKEKQFYLMDTLSCIVHPNKPKTL